MPHSQKITAIFLIGLTAISIYLAVKIGITEKELAAGFIIGISSGLLATVVLLAVKHLVSGSVNPWIENLLYRDAHLEGTWIGVLVPHVGIDEIDRIIKENAFNVIRAMQREDQDPKKPSVAPSKNIPAGNLVPIEAHEITASGEKQKIEAEIVFPSGITSNTENSSPKKTVQFTISFPPTKVRFDLSRVGHKISGTLTELGGASSVHTYRLDGEFRNLILAGVYENHNKASLDRGSLSLMLLKNGESLEGFFSSYMDENSRIGPMKCMLVKNSQTALPMNPED